MNFKLTRACDSCNEKDRTINLLRDLLEQEKFNNKELLKRLLDKPVVEPEPKMEMPKPILGKNQSWSVTRRTLEERDRAIAEEQKRTDEIIKERERIESLEKELGVNE